MMKSVDESCREEPLDGFFCVEISDLVASSLAGGALAGVTANAYAFGNSTLAGTNTNTSARQLAGGGSIAFGRGTATAIGNNPSSNVSVFGAGDVVVGYTSTYSTQKKSVSTGFVLAVDFP
jgi:hypothetical protein